MNSLAFNLGIAAGMTEHAWSMDKLAAASGRADILSARDGVLGKRILKAAHNVLVSYGEAKSAEANHLALVAEADWTSHGRDVLDLVLDSLSNISGSKQAGLGGLGTLVEEGLAGAKGLGETGLMASVAGGGGLGSLYWLLNRDATGEEDNIRLKQEQANTYQRLAKDLKARLASKYGYGSGV